MSRPRRDSWWKRDRAEPVPDSDDHGAVPAADDELDLAKTYNRRPRAASQPTSPPAPGPIEQLATTVKRLKVAIGVLVIPVIASGKMAFTMVAERVESNTLAKIERQRLIDDVAALRAETKAQHDAIQRQAGLIRDAEEALRFNARRIEDLLQDRPRRSREP